MAEDTNKDFFVSYNKADRIWAEWIAWQLEAQGYTTILQAWDFRPGSNFVLEMQSATSRAKRTIAVLSPDYLTSLYTQPEWAAALVQDPTGQNGTLLPVRVHGCELTGLLSSIVYLDLVDLDESEAAAVLLTGVSHTRAKPSHAPRFPDRTPRLMTPPPRFPSSLPPMWNVPFRRNPFFTGREALLAYLHDQLINTKSAALTQAQAIRGLGGIGKTQTAIEYAYRHRDAYRYVLWVNATTRDTILTSFLELAVRLNLPEREEQDQNRIVAAVTAWFTTNDGWLLIFDNADDLSLVEEFLPPGGRGHLLLTTRVHAPSTLAYTIEVEQMGLHEGMLFLLHRARLLAPDATLEEASAADRITAEVIVREMDGLPLALDQAGAYLEETQCTLAAYLQQYRNSKHQYRLLQRRGRTSQNHPESVATTWSLSFTQVEQLNPLAADLLRCCAFLAPDAIPEQLLLDGASELGPHFQALLDDASLINEAIETLLRFSLVKRKREEATLALHRLVQAILRTSIDEQTQQVWIERTVRAVNRAFPDVRDYRNWSRGQQYLPHALACTMWIRDGNPALPEAGNLFNTLGYYLKQRAQYVEAEPLYQRAIAIGEKVLGPEHPDLATWLNNLAALYQAQGKYTEAKPLYQRAIAIDAKVLGPEHPNLATDLNNLALLYIDQSKYAEAEPLYQRAIAIGEKVLGPEHPDLANWLSNLANLYTNHGKYAQAEPLFERAIAIGEKVLGPEHPNLATWLNNLATLYRYQGKYAGAEPLFERAIAIDEKVLDPEHLNLATWRINLAILYADQSKYAEAKPLFERAIATRERKFGNEHPLTAAARASYTAMLKKRRSQEPGS